MLGSTPPKLGAPAASKGHSERGRPWGSTPWLWNDQKPAEVSQTLIPSKDSSFKAFGAQRPYYMRLLGYFDAKGNGPPKDPMLGESRDFFKGI